MKKNILIALFLIVMVVIYSSYFIVDETEQVVITQLGKPVRKPILDAGIYWKIPLIEKANFFEKRILEWDSQRDEAIPTLDKKNINIDATARWRIVDPLKFLQTVGSENAAQKYLDHNIDSNIREIINEHDLIEIVRNSNRVLEVIKTEFDDESFAVVQDKKEVAQLIIFGREKLTREILKKSQPVIKNYGIELIDVRIKRLMYSKAVLDAVYNRMISQYKIKAQNLRSEGDKKKAQIEGETEYEVKKIRSGAYKKAQKIRGEGDAIAAKTYADALQVDPNFYQFQKSLEAYDTAIDKNSFLIIGTDSEFFRVLKYGSKF